MKVDAVPLRSVTPVFPNMLQLIEYCNANNVKRDYILEPGNRTPVQQITMNDSDCLHRYMLTWQRTDKTVQQIGKACNAKNNPPAPDMQYDWQYRWTILDDREHDRAEDLYKYGEWRGSLTWRVRIPGATVTGRNNVADQLPRLSKHGRGGMEAPERIAVYGCRYGTVSMEVRISNELNICLCKRTSQMLRFICSGSIHRDLNWNISFMQLAPMKLRVFWQKK